MCLFEEADRAFILLGSSGKSLFRAVVFNDSIILYAAHGFVSFCFRIFQLSSCDWRTRSCMRVRKQCPCYSFACDFIVLDLVITVSCGEIDAGVQMFARVTYRCINLAHILVCKLLHSYSTFTSKSS